MLINGYPDGSDLTLINTMYCRPKKDPETGKYDNGSLTIIYKDNTTGEKKLEVIDNPTYTFYKAKDDECIENNMLFIDEDRVEPVKVPFKDIDKKIADMTDNKQFYYENIRNGNRYANKRLHTIPELFSSDADIEDYYRLQFSRHYKDSVCDITKSFFDIEADTINMKGDFPEPGECPINAVTIIFKDINKVYTLLLRNPENPLIEEFEKSINNNTFIELKDFVRDALGGWKNEKRFKVDQFQYEIMFYDLKNEIQLIQDLFALINTIKPDFLLVWNMAFDLPYIIQRIKNLGFRPESIICNKDFSNKIANYWVDERNYNEKAERGDHATISSYTVYLDQMIHFASRRKGQSAFDRFNLDYIGERVAKVRKLDYSHITTSIAKLPYLDYKTFVFYNIMDTIVQHCIEIKTGDIDYVFNKCLINNTRYHKCHRQTVYLVNRTRKEFLKDGFILGNNSNRFNEKPKTKYPGAFVANPKLTTDYAKIILNGMGINVYNNLDDFDYKSLYPSIMQEFNMAHHTQIGRVLVDEGIYENENRFNDLEHYNRNTEFIENFQSHVFLEFATRWLHLADYSTLYKDIEEYYTNIKLPFRFKPYNPQTGKFKPFNFVNKDLKRTPWRFHPEGEKIKVFDFYKQPNFDNINEYFKERC